MVNPYELIDRRLSAIESVLQEMQQQSSTTATADERRRTNSAHVCDSEPVMQRCRKNRLTQRRPPRCYAEGLKENYRHQDDLDKASANGQGKKSFYTTGTQNNSCQRGLC